MDHLATDFWAWRAQYRPFTGDDIPRMEHTGGVRDWSATAVAKQRVDLAGFEQRWKAMQDDRLAGRAAGRLSADRVGD